MNHHVIKEECFIIEHKQYLSEQKIGTLRISRTSLTKASYKCNATDDEEN